MRLAPWLVVILLVAPAIQGCEGRRETPPDVAQAFSTLVISLDPNTPGASLVSLREFSSRHAGYSIASDVDKEIASWRGKLEPAYLRGRDLVREGKFEQAEAVLKDLALVPDEKAGRLSREFLAFEYPQLKATRLLQKGDSAGAEAVLRGMTQTELSEDQMAATQRLLDAASIAGAGAVMTRTTAMQSAARALHVLLLSSYMDNGQYPAALTLDSPELAPLRDGGSLGVVASIDDYRATQDTFSLILTGKDPRQRIRVTQTGIEDLSPQRQP